MNEETLKKIERDLTDRRDKIESELKKFTEGNDEASDALFPHFGDKEDDNAAEVAEYSDSLSLEESLQNSLRDINKALEEIKDGTYGICRYCKQPIDEKRLLARPASTACISCKNKLSKT